MIVNIDVIKINITNNGNLSVDIMKGNTIDENIEDDATIKKITINSILLNGII